MVAGHLSVKNGNYYAVLNYKNSEGKRKTKWISLGLPEKGNKSKAEAELAKLRAEFEVPEEVGDLSSDMLFADYLLEWLEIAKGRLAIATYSSYLVLIKSVIEPYFRKKKLTLRELEARHLQMFYSEQLKKVKPNTVIHYHAVIHSALKYAVKTDMLLQNVADKVDRPKKNDFQPVFLSAEEMQKHNTSKKFFHIVTNWFFLTVTNFVCSHTSTVKVFINEVLAHSVSRVYHVIDKSLILSLVFSKKLFRKSFNVERIFDVFNFKRISFIV